MAVAFRSDADVTNGTAGTSVTVAKPSGTVDGDHLIAFISAAGAPSITPPAGWTLITSVASGSSVTLWAYRKLAASEGANWTWTLGSSLRNWGWVGASTGVDPDDPVYEPTFGGGQGGESDTTLESNTTLITGTGARPASMVVSAAAAVRTASGSATTWTFTEFGGEPVNERSDLSTNAGAGTDICGVIGDLSWMGSYTNLVFPQSVASQAQTAGASYCLALRPYFTPYDGGDVGLVVEAAFGADPDGDQADWTWTPITSLVHQPANVEIAPGRPTATSTADPTRISFTLLNLNGEFTKPGGTYTEQFVRNLPFRVRLTGFGVGNTDGYHRGTAFLASARPRWDESLNFSVVDVDCRGRLWRLQRDATTKPAHSAGYRSMIGLGSGAVAPVAYWPFEDESGATSASPATDGTANAAVAGVTFGGNGTLYEGSAALATFTATSAVSAPVQDYDNTDHWAVVWAESIPSEPGAQTVLAFITTTGTARRWRVSITPGASALVLDVFDTTGSSVLSTSVSITSEADFYAHPMMFGVSAAKNGTGVDYRLDYFTATEANGTGGTIAGQTGGKVVLFQTVYDAGVTGATFGHLGVYSDPAFDISLFSGIEVATGVIAGNDGETPVARFERICDEEGIDNTFGQPEVFDLTMGPQPIATTVDLFREGEAVYNTVIHDAGSFVGETGLVYFPGHDERDNAAVVLTLDRTLGQIAPGFEPNLDDQDIVNDVEVSRDGGSSARATDENSISVEGRYPRQYTVNTEDDTFLRDLASWRVNVGTAGHQVGVMRFPRVDWNLRRSPELAEEWLACEIGSKLRITNPPTQYPPDDIDTFIEGYTETLSTKRWEVRANLSPAAPYGVFELAETSADAGEFVGRLAGDDDAAIRVAIDDNDTSIEFDPNRCRWTTVADDFDPDLSVRFGMETADVSTIATTAATYVAAGAMSSADNAAVTPALYAGGTARDLILVLARIRSVSAGTLATPTGYTRLPIKNLSATDKMQLFAKVHSGSESNPTVTPSGGSAGDTVSAVTFGLRGMPCTLEDLADIVVDSWGLINASAQNIAYPGLYPRLQEGCVVLALGGKDDDWTSVATLTGFAEAVDSSTTTGSDQGLVVDYVIQTTPAVVNEGSFTVTGGASAVSHGALIALAGGYQTMTVSARSTNGVVKSHAAGTKIEVDKPYVLGM